MDASGFDPGYRSLTDDSRSLAERLRIIHEALRVRFPGIGRIAVALYDPGTDTVKTFAHASDTEEPLVHYEAHLADVPSLQALAAEGGHRIVGDLTDYGNGNTTHTRRVREAYRSSVTWPLYRNGNLAGFLFFNSREPDYFTEDVVTGLDFARELIILLVVNTLKTVEAIRSTAAVAKEVSHYRDEETGSHLERIAHYARLVARVLAGEHGLSDEFVELVYLFAPLHDLGKVAIPDNVLLKPGRLTDEEFAIMRTHAAKGDEMAERIVEGAGLDPERHGHILRAIVRHHHEAWDGSGYPDGLAGEAIPLAARVTAIGDVYDALTSSRPYKKAWTPDEAADLLRRESGTKFDPACVRAFLDNFEEVQAIARLFVNDETFPDVDTAARSA